jgi:hypothetical protein
MLKKLTTSLLASLGLLLAFIPAGAKDNGYEIKIQIKGPQRHDLLPRQSFRRKAIPEGYRARKSRWLGSYSKGKDSLVGGIYLIVIAQQNYFEILVSDPQKFTIETDTVDFG